jgi:hypothetical protein
MDTVVAKLASFLAENREQHARRHVIRMQEEVPGYFIDCGLDGVELAIESTADWQMGFSSAIARSAPIPDVPPPMALREAFVTARTGIPWSAVEKTIWVGQREIIGEMFRWARGENLEQGTEHEVLHHAVRVVGTYCAELATMLAGEYELERDRCVRRGEHRRIDAIKGLLAGMEISDAPLGYSLDCEHLGAVAWGVAAEESLREIGERLGCRLLLSPGGGGSMWAWFGGRPSIKSSPDTLDAWDLPADTYIALGTRRPGRTGFVASHNEALEAQRVGRLSGETVTRYDNVAIEAFLLRDERMAHAFVRRELRGIADSTERSTRLRETLGAYFRLGNNGTAAAANLGVHERTIAYRLSQVESTLGYRAYLRREEISVALRLRTLLFAED